MNYIQNNALNNNSLSHKIKKGTMVFKQSKIIWLNILQVLMWFRTVTRMSLRSGLPWLTLNLAVIIQRSSRINIFVSMLHTP
jgi:hypothetical protein